MGFFVAVSLILLANSEQSSFAPGYGSNHVFNLLIPIFVGKISCLSWQPLSTTGYPWGQGHCICRLNHQIYTHVMLKNGEKSYKKAIKAHTLEQKLHKKERAAENCVLESNACKESTCMKS